MKGFSRSYLPAVLALLMACAGPPKTKLDLLYQGLAEPLPRIDASILEGRRILIDPGHGGYFRGAVGRASVEESSVNLGVSLYLWGLLREAGADVYLTRAIDRDFLSDGDSSLAADLHARVAITDSLGPDVFISIHHNAQPARDAEKNSVETYYRAGDPASLDLAFAVHRHLMRNLGIDDGEVRQGNYLVLRESDAPAILGEASYLTHPLVEDKLRLSETQKLEAEAYFLGLLEYFERGIPKIRRISPEDSVLAAVPTLSFAMWDDGGPGIDPDGVKMFLNGRRVFPFLDVFSQTATWHPAWDTPNGDYELELSVRNSRGNSSPVHRTGFAIDFPPAIATFETTPEYLPLQGGVIRLRARLLDRRGLVVKDGTRVTLTTSAGTGAIETAVSNGAIEVPLTTIGGEQALVVTLACAGNRFDLAIKAQPEKGPSLSTFFLRDAVTHRPIYDASVIQGDTVIQSGSSTGHYFCRFDTLSTPGPSSKRIQAPGYLPAPLLALASDTLEMTPWFGGALSGRRFVIDPEGGTSSASGKGPLGLSGAYVNLRVADYLAGFCRAGGADALLSRENEEVRTVEDVARITNRYLADLYVEIRHRGESADSGRAVTAFFFPGSRNGESAARSVSAAMARRLKYPVKGPYEKVTYPLQQTACPAIVVEAPSLSMVEEELRLAESWYQREQAYAVFLGVLGYYALRDSNRVVVSVDHEEPAGWRITVDHAWTLVTGPDGLVEFEALPPGSHHLTVQKGPAKEEHYFVSEAGGLTEVRVVPSS